MTALDDLAFEELPCRRLPKPDNTQGPSALFAARERQRALWAGEFNDTPTVPSKTKEAANG